MKRLGDRPRPLVTLLAAPLVLALACGNEGGAGGSAEAGGASGAMSVAGSGGSATAGALGGGSGGAGSVVAGGSAGGQPSQSGGVSGGGGGSVSAGSGGRGGAGESAGSGGKASGGSAATGGSSAGSKPLKVFLAGDSTVQECSGTCPCGWGSRFDPLFDDQVTVVNRAVGGRSIQTWLYEAAVTDTLGSDGECSLSSDTFDKRWRDMLDPTSGMQPGDYLFIQFGINDGDRTCPRHVGLDAFQKYLALMADAANQRGAQAVFVTPVSAIACSGNQAAPTRGAFVDATVAAAMQSGVPVIDLHKASIALYDSLGFCPNDEDYANGALGAFFCNDHTHFEAAGAVQIAALVAAGVTQQALPLAAHLR